MEEKENANINMATKMQLYPHIWKKYNEHHEGKRFTTSRWLPSFQISHPSKTSWFNVTTLTGLTLIIIIILIMTLDSIRIRSDLKSSHKRMKRKNKKNMKNKMINEVSHMKPISDPITPYQKTTSWVETFHLDMDQL